MVDLKHQIPLPFINELSSNSLADIKKNIRKLSFGKGQMIIEKGQRIEGVYIVKSGSARIFSLDINGNEKPIDTLITGEICVFSINCVLNQLVFPAWLKVDSTEAEILAIPATTFKRVYQHEPSVSGFMLEAMSKRIYSMMSIIEETTTFDIGSRINNFLIRSCPESQTINIGHQEIANQLGTAREVVSRHLKTLEKLQLVKLSRMRIDILSPQRLANIHPVRKIL